jgi:hypothetical protein
VPKELNSNRSYKMTRTMAKSVALVAALTVSLAAVTQAETIGKAIGYTKIELPDPGDLAMMTASYKSESGSSMTLKDIFGDNSLKGFAIATGADNVFVYNGSGYDGFYKKTDTGDFYPIGQNYTTNPVVSAGTGFWVKGGSQASSNRVTYITGQAVESLGVTLAQGLNMSGIGVTKPVDLVADIDWSSVEGAKGFVVATGADQIYVYNGSGYNAYYLNNSYQWQVIGGDPASSITLDVGDGFWYRAQNASVALSL